MDKKYPVTFQWPCGVWGPLLSCHPVNREISRYEAIFLFSKRRWTVCEIDKMIFDGIQQKTLTPAQHWALKIMKFQAMSGLMA